MNYRRDQLIPGLSGAQGVPPPFLNEWGMTCWETLRRAITTYIACLGAGFQKWLRKRVWFLLPQYPDHPTEIQGIWDFIVKELK